MTPRPAGRPDQAVPQPPPRNPCRVSHVTGLASSPFAHHYSGNRGCFLFLRVLRCFTSPRYHQPPYAFRRRRPPMTGARFPHSETPGSQPGCRLPGAYRRLQRPSSAPGAKASTVCPKKLGTYETCSAENRRCSRPLCSSQKTDGTSHPRTPKGTRTAAAPEDPGHIQPVPSGPNSVPTPPAASGARSGIPARGHRTDRAARPGKNE